MFPQSETGRFSGVLLTQRPPVRLQVRWSPSWKICLRIQLSFGLLTIENNILEVLVEGFVSPILQIGDIDKITTKTNGKWESGRHFSVEYRHHLRPRMDGIVCKTYQTYNYADPVYGVATICHQVRCLRWGHPSLFYIAMSLLIWYRMFCMRDISYRLIWMKYINMFSVYGQSGTHRPFNWWIIAVFT